MTVGLSESPNWTRRRRWSILTLIFVSQLAIIFWLGDREPIRPRAAAAGSKLNLVEDKSQEMLALTDPTLFALPHRQGFSGLAWLKSPTQDFRSFAWSEPPQWLQMPSGLLGAAFELFVATNASNPLQAMSQTEPDLRLPELPATRDFPEHSTLRLTGDLVNRRLLSSIDLPSWPNSEILTNSQVQLAIDAAGKPLSVTLLYPGSGYKDADTNAVWQATRARFEPLSVSDAATNLLSGLSWGQMIFEWHTLPLPPTNAVQGVK